MTSQRRVGRALRRVLTLGLAAGLSLTIAVPAGAPSTLLAPCAGHVSLLLPHPHPTAPAYTVTANDHYAIVVVPNPGTSVMWAVVTSAAYAGGQVWMGNQPSTWTLMANRAFNFKTYVTPGSAASAPTVTRVKSDVPVTEGTAPTNSGTFADAAGLTVHLTASAGTLTYTPSTSRTWTSAGTAADQGPSQTTSLISPDDRTGGA